MTTTVEAQGPVDVNVRGVCGTCVSRGADGRCQSKKLSEDYGQSDDEKAEMLIYDYSEGDSFWVGERFGCIHHTLT